MTPAERRADALEVMLQIMLIIAAGLWLFIYANVLLIERDTAAKLSRIAAALRIPAHAGERCVPLLTARSHGASSRSDAARVRECFPLAREARHG